MSGSIQTQASNRLLINSSHFWPVDKPPQHRNGTPRVPHEPVSMPVEAWMVYLAQLHQFLLSLQPKSSCVDDPRCRTFLKQRYSLLADLVTGMGNTQPCQSWDFVCHVYGCGVASSRNCSRRFECFSTLVTFGNVGHRIMKNQGSNNQPRTLLPLS